MKKINFKFKSLTMRIWATFNIVILIIICSISLIYMLAYRRIDEKSKAQDLKVAHDVLIKSGDYSEPVNGFDKLKNLKGSDYFIYYVDDNKTGVIDVNKRGQMDHPPQDKNVQFQDKSIHMPPGFVDNSTKMWMGSFAKTENITDSQIVKYYNGRKYIFIISSIDITSISSYIESGTSGKYYLVSYIPNMEDNTLIYMVIGIGLLFIVIGFFAAKIVANYISKPLKKLEDYTIRIAHKDWKEPIMVNSQDEIGRLANSMNHMQNELKRADEEEKMFLQSISHDLKTPVMVIMSHADAIIDGVYIDSVETTAQIIRDEAINLEKKIKQMLYLNTLDYVLDNNEQNDEIRLHDLLHHIISRFEVINSKIQWDLSIEKININANADKIQVAIENILDNGLRYAEEKIIVTLKKDGNFAVMELYNDGPNIPEKHIDHIFDNLYKDKTGNFGLGLAISKKIIDFYKGEIKAVNREKGVSFIIKLPC